MYGPIGPSVAQSLGGFINLSAKWYDPVQFGAIYGAVSDAQATLNLEALQTCITRATAPGPKSGIVLTGNLRVNGTVNATGLGASNPVYMFGMGTGQSQGGGITFVGPSGTAYLFDLTGTAGWTFDRITFDGGSLANYALFAGRTNTPSAPSSGKHTFDHCTFNHALIAAHYNYGSEANIYIQCQFLHSPIGLLSLGYPAVADPTVLNAVPFDTSGNVQSAGFCEYYNCQFGTTDMARAGIISAASQMKVYGGYIQAASTSEAGWIMDGTQATTTIIGLGWDSQCGGSGLKIGYYSNALVPSVNWLNRIYAASLDFGPGMSITNLIDGYNMRGCTFSTIRAPTGAAYETGGIVLRDANCISNIFENVSKIADGTDIPISTSAAAGDNVRISHGRISRANPGLPVISALNVGIASAVLQAGSTDLVGAILVTIAGTGPGAAADLFTVTFSQSFPSVPIMSVSPAYKSYGTAGGNLGNLGWAPLSVAVGSFHVTSATAPTAALLYPITYTAELP